MIREYKDSDLVSIMQIWLHANIEAHNFILSEYWNGSYDMVKEMLPQAEIYVHEDDIIKQIAGFVGLKWYGTKDNRIYV